MTPTTPQFAMTRIVDAPRAHVYEAFTAPDLFASWWGPFGNALSDVKFDLRPGGIMQWSEVFVDDPSVWTNGRIDLTDVVDGELLDGVMRIAGELPGNYEGFETRMRVEFYDETDGRTRLEVFQWLREDYVAPTTNGWGEAFTKLDAALTA